MAEQKKQDALSVGTEIESEHKPTYEWLKSYLEENKKLPPAEELYEHIATDHIGESGEAYYDPEIGLQAMEKRLEKLQVAKNEAKRAVSMIRDGDVVSVVFEKNGLKFERADVDVVTRGRRLVTEMKIKLNGAKALDEKKLKTLREDLGGVLGFDVGAASFMNSTLSFSTVNDEDFFDTSKLLSESLKRDVARHIRDSILIKRALNEKKSAIILFNTDSDEYAAAVAEIAEMVEKN